MTAWPFRRIVAGRSDGQGVPSGARCSRLDVELQEEREVLLDDEAEDVPNRSHPEHCLVLGFTFTGRFIAVPYEILDERHPYIRPITAFEPSEC